MNKQSRRKFLKTTAIASAGVVAGSAAVNSLSPRIWPEPMIFETNQSHWAKTQVAASPSLEKDLEADVAIIGGGFTGLSSAYYIRKNQPAKKVVVLEARGCGNGASGRNGAMVLTMTADRFMQFSGDPTMDKRIYDLTVENIDQLHALSAATGIDCELDTNGALQVFNTKADLETGRAYAERARKLGMDVELWDRQQTFEALGTRMYEGAFLDRRCGQVHPMKLVQVFKSAAQSAGAEIFENTAVARIEEGSPIRLHTTNGRRVTAKSLVMASNAYTSKLGFFRNGIVPIFNYVGITPRLSDTQIAELGWRSRLPFSDSRTIVTYLGLTRDNRIHIGGGSADYFFNDGGSQSPNVGQAFRKLQSELERIFPRLADVQFETTWSGLVDCSLDFSSSVGRLRDNIYYGIGYCGHGVNLTSLFGRIIADFEAGHDQQWRDLPFVNHCFPYVPNEPFRWLGAQASLAYYRSAG
jgi:glycine/D-amino acid oxidase-like deaminating enzyme